MEKKMAYFMEERPGGPAMRERRPTVNEFFLSVYQLQPYAGCEFGCSYCDGWAYSLRPFNESVRAFVDLPERLAEDIGAVDRGDLIALTLSDPYQPAEQSYRLTRQILQILAERRQPCLILTKSLSVLEDLAYLQRLNSESLAVVMTSIVTTDPRLAARLEGKAPPPLARLEMLAELRRAGVPVGVALMPIIPYLTDTPRHLDATLEAIAGIQPDFVVWEYLWQPNDRHKVRVAELLSRLGNYPAGYYRDLYGQEIEPSEGYRRNMDRELLGRIEALGLDARPPLGLYRDHLAPNTVAALLLKHQAFQDTVKGRAKLAERHRELAEEIFRGTALKAELAGSPLWPVLREILKM
jgi:DNA repair photolyase